MISDDEFGRCFEVGEADRRNGLPLNLSRYKDEIRQMAYSDGWKAENAAIENAD